SCRTESERVLSEQVYTVPFLLASPDAEVATQDKEPEGEEEPEAEGGLEDSCVVCLSRPRECVLLGCGHICCCFRCFQALPTRLCPICRGPIDRVVPLYQA
uniref:RING-type domain-containing protein n=1 Tax=Anas zonorhyncha TaxID=75864 RepID=A0A8B9UNT7_9AVES